MVNSTAPNTELSYWVPHLGDYCQGESVPAPPHHLYMRVNLLLVSNYSVNRRQALAIVTLSAHNSKILIG